MVTIGFPDKASAMDQGSVLVHNTKTDSHRCDVLQPEIVPNDLANLSTGKAPNEVINLIL